MAKEMICTNCGIRGDSKTFTPGSFFIEVILWICFIVPGVIYSIWRLTAKKKVCCACGSGPLIPTDTPVGRQLIAKFENLGK